MDQQMVARQCTAHEIQQAEQAILAEASLPPAKNFVTPADSPSDPASAERESSSKKVTEKTVYVASAAELESATSSAGNTGSASAKDTSDKRIVVSEQYDATTKSVQTDITVIVKLPPGLPPVSQRDSFALRQEKEKLKKSWDRIKELDRLQRLKLAGISTLEHSDTKVSEPVSNRHQQRQLYNQNNITPQSVTALIGSAPQQAAAFAQAQLEVVTDSISSLQTHSRRERRLLSLLAEAGQQFQHLQQAIAEGTQQRRDLPRMIENTGLTLRKIVSTYCSALPGREAGQTEYETQQSLANGTVNDAELLLLTTMQDQMETHTASNESLLELTRLLHVERTHQIIATEYPSKTDSTASNNRLAVSDQSSVPSFFESFIERPQLPATLQPAVVNLKAEQNAEKSTGKNTEQSHTASIVWEALSEYRALRDAGKVPAPFSDKELLIPEQSAEPGQSTNATVPERDGEAIEPVANRAKVPVRFSVVDRLELIAGLCETQHLKTEDKAHLLSPAAGAVRDRITIEFPEQQQAAAAPVPDRSHAPAHTNESEAGRSSPQQNPDSSQYQKSERNISKTGKPVTSARSALETKALLLNLLRAGHVPEVTVVSAQPAAHEPVTNAKPQQNPVTVFQKRKQNRQPATHMPPHVEAREIGTPEKALIKSGARTVHQLNNAAGPPALDLPRRRISEGRDFNPGRRRPRRLFSIGGGRSAEAATNNKIHSIENNARSIHDR